MSKTRRVRAANDVVTHVAQPARCVRCDRPLTEDEAKEGRECRIAVAGCYALQQARALERIAAALEIIEQKLRW